jgi:hypothetical protein
LRDDYRRSRLRLILAKCTRPSECIHEQYWA